MVGKESLLYSGSWPPAMVGYCPKGRLPEEVEGF